MSDDEKRLVRDLACAYLTLERESGGAAVEAVIAAANRLPWETDEKRAARLEAVAHRAADLWGRR